MGAFNERENYLPEHYRGEFAVEGKRYHIFVLIHPEKSFEDRILFQPLNNEMLFSEENGLSVFYRWESITFDSLIYDIVGFSKRNDRYLLKKEDVPYSNAGLPRGSAAPDFSKTTLSGEKIELNELRGTYVLLDFWGTWCVPCLKETPYLKEAYKKFKDQVEFIGIAVDSDPDKVIEYVEAQDIGWHQIYVERSFPKPTAILTDYNVRGYPAYFLIDPAGKIVLGPEDDVRLRGERLEETLKRVLNGDSSDW